MLTVADSMPSHTCLTGILLAVDKHSSLETLETSQLRHGGLGKREVAEVHEGLRAGFPNWMGAWREVTGGRRASRVGSSRAGSVELGAGYTLQMTATSFPVVEGGKVAWNVETGSWIGCGLACCNARRPLVKV